MGLVVLTTLAACDDACVVAYRYDEHSGLWVASGCGQTLILATPTPSPTPKNS